MKPLDDYHRQNHQAVLVGFESAKERVFATFQMRVAFSCIFLPVSAINVSLVVMVIFLSISQQHSKRSVRNKSAVVILSFFFLLFHCTKSPWESP